MYNSQNDQNFFKLRFKLLLSCQLLWRCFSLYCSLWTQVVFWSQYLEWPPEENCRAVI